MVEQQAPLAVCMENVNGEEVTFRVEPEDDFQSFLMKAKSILGFDVDLNSITRNQPVSLTDNIYQFLLTSEQYTQNMTMQNFSDMLEPSNDANDLVYILDDGTQIRASQIHFDNEDPQVDLTAEKIPFVKCIDGEIEESDEENVAERDTKKYNIVDSPVSRWSSNNSSPKCSFVNSLPFKLVCNNTSVFEAQFTKYLESSTPKTYTTLNPVVNRNKSPRSLIRENYKSYDDKFNRGDDFSGYTREEILNMFKDSPVASAPYENFTDKRKHARKSDPTRSTNKNWNCKPTNYEEGILIGDNENRNCFICGKFVENNIEKLYLFDTEDQKLHRSSPQKKSSRQLKIICESCLGKNFKPCRMKGPNQCLNPDEYLVIRNNQQYIFQKTNMIDFRGRMKNQDGPAKNESKTKKRKEEKVEFVKLEIGSDGEIVTKPVDNDPRSSEDVVIVNDEGKDDSSDVEIVLTPEMDENIVDNLDDADEDVKEFLGKYQCENLAIKELKCRFCERLFDNVSEVMRHVNDHKHDSDEGVVYPCPICEYGYANSIWLKGHLKAAHDRIKKEDIKTVKTEIVEENNNDKKLEPKNASPVAKRTRSSLKKNEDSTNDTKDNELKTEEEEEEKKPKSTEESDPPHIVIKTEVKQEALESSEDEIWIVQTGDEPTDQLENLINAAAKRAEVRSNSEKQPENENLLVVRSRRKKSQEPTSSDPQIVTCDDCNESFTSKVRLKFHVQFHYPTNMLTSEGKYKCPQCGDCTFSDEGALFDHVHFRHHKRRRWHCPVRSCGKTFHLRATLTKHSRTHTDTRRYVCVTCGKRFLDKQTLDEHGVTHLQIKPFQCHICSKQLTRRSRLRMHLRAHEEELTPKLVLVCAVCSRAFRDKDDAQNHTTKSTECIEEFTKELKEEMEEGIPQLSPTSGLVREPTQVTKSPQLSKPIHRQVMSPLARPLLASLSDEAISLIRVVEIEKAFRCEYCEDVFYLEDGLNAHRAIHKNVKNPFTCHICKVSFATYSRCTTHKTTHGFYKRPLSDAKEKALAPSSGPSATGILGYGGFPVVKHFLCEDCGRSYLHWTYLQVHRRMKHANDNFLYKCNPCNVTFPNSWSLAYHRKKLHGQSGLGDTGTTSKIPREDYRIPCRDCEEVLPNKTALYKHRKKEHSDMSLQMNVGPGTSWCDSCNRQRTSKCGDHHQKNLGSSAIRNRLVQGVRAWACSRCPKRFRTRSELRAHARLKHPAHLAIIEIRGLNPTPDEVLEHLRLNNIAHDKVIDITKISFLKGASSIIPNSARALAMLGHVQRTPVAYSKPIGNDNDYLGRGIAKTIRRTNVQSQVEQTSDQNQFPISIDVTEELPHANVQKLIQDGVLSTSFHMLNKSPQ
ncbi:unnamed protein product [Chilo suppressalis]|uniref:C2H2-type domain-containing protein n=1 Tax=Chilo suppressalis TaxID=168631 RepID=A0ABN8L953_CHISP|nr:unnamed protein product [Chilo suppressalis]